MRPAVVDGVRASVDEPDTFDAPLGRPPANQQQWRPLVYAVGVDGLEPSARAITDAWRY